MANLPVGAGASQLLGLTALLEAWTGVQIERERTRQLEIQCEAAVRHAGQICETITGLVGANTRKIEALCQALPFVREREVQRAMVSEMVQLRESEAANVRILASNLSGGRGWLLPAGEE